jgi:type I restriction enzyme R subunit
MELQKYADRWFLDFEDVRYEAYNYKDGELANENKLKDSADYAAYREATPDALPKFKFRKAMIEEFREMMRTEICPLME